MSSSGWDFGRAKTAKPKPRSASTQRWSDPGTGGMLAKTQASTSGALEGDDAAREAFERLSYSHRRRHVMAIEEAKTPETRQRRVTKALEMLREGRR